MMTTNRRWILLAFILPMLAPLAAAHAQRFAPAQTARLNRWWATLEARGEYIQNRVDRVSGERSDWSRYVSPALRLGNSGYIYHPRFVNFDFSGRLSWIDSRQVGSIGGFEERRRGVFDTYNTRVGAFKDHPIRFEWIMDRSQSRVRVSQVPDVISDNRRHSLILNWQKRFLPMSLQYENWRRTTRGRFGSDERQTSVQFASRLRGRQFSGNLRFDRTRLHNPRLGFDFIRYTGKLNATASPGLWITGGHIRWWRQERDARSESIQGAGSLRRDLGSGLSADAALNLQRLETVSGERDASIEMVLSLIHELYKSLSSDLSIRARDEKPGSGRLRMIDAEIRSAYRKHIPLGKLFLNGSLRRIERRIEGATIRQSVLARNFRFDKSDEILLPERDIDPVTIEVADSVGVVPFEEDQDYQVEMTGIGTILRRIPGGAILPNALVRVSYSHETTGRQVEGIETVGGGAQVRLRSGFFAGLSGSRSEPVGSNDASTPGFGPSTRRRVNAGWRHGLTGIEWEERRWNDAVLPYERERFTARAGGALGRHRQWTVNATNGSTTFLEERTRYDFRKIRGQLQWRATRYASLALAARMSRDENRSGHIETRSLSADLTLRLALGIFTVQWRGERLDSDNSGLHRSQFVAVTFERKIQ